jgi:hypothetical protein
MEPFKIRPSIPLVVLHYMSHQVISTMNNNLDIVVTNANDDDIGMLLGNGDGTFQNQTT